MVCDKFIGEYDIDAQITKIQALYGSKCRLMLDEMDKKIPKEVKYTRPDGGLFLWCTLPDYVDMTCVVKKAIENKVAVVPGSAFLPDESVTSHCFRLNFSMPSDGQIVEGIDILANTLKSFIK